MFADEFARAAVIVLQQPPQASGLHRLRVATSLPTCHPDSCLHSQTPLVLQIVTVRRMLRAHPYTIPEA